MKTKVWHLSSNRWNSAITGYAVGCCKALDRSEGFESVFTPVLDSQAHRAASVHGLRLAPSKKLSLAGIVPLIGVFRVFRPRIIVAYGGPEFVVALLFKLLFSVKVVRFKGDVFRGAIAKLGLGSLSLSTADLCLTPSRALSHVDDMIAMNPQPTRIVLGTDERQFMRLDPAPKEPGRPFLLIFGRLDPVKGHLPFLRIFREFLVLLKKHPFHGEKIPQLRIVGQEANLSVNDIEREASRLDLCSDDLVLESRRVEQPQRLMQAAQVGVVSSVGSEWICRVGQEFLLCGTPVFVSGVGSLQELVEGEAWGESYKGLDPSEAASKLVDLYLSSFDEGLRLAIARNAVQELSLERMQKELEEALGILN